MSTAPSPAPAHPILHNLGALLLKYGPMLLQLLIQYGVIKLPPGVTLPPLPVPGAAADPAVLAQLNKHNVEVALKDLLALIQDLAALASETAA